MRGEAAAAAQRLEAPASTVDEGLPLGVAGRRAQEEYLAGDEGRRIGAPGQIVEIVWRKGRHPPVVHEVQDVLSRVENAMRVAGRKREFYLSAVSGTPGEPETTTDRAGAKTMPCDPLVERIQGRDDETVHLFHDLESVKRDLDLLPAKRRERQMLKSELGAGALEQPRTPRADLPGSRPVRDPRYPIGRGGTNASGL